MLGRLVAEGVGWGEAHMKGWIIPMVYRGRSKEGEGKGVSLS